MILNRLSSSTTAGLVKPDGITISADADGVLSVIGQVPTHATAVPALAAVELLLANGTYLTGPELLAMLGLTASGSAAPAPISGTAYAGTLSLAQPTLTRIYQRDTRTGGTFGKGAGTVGLAVTLTAPVTTLDYRLRDADAAGNPMRQDWTALGGAEAAGTVTLSPSIPASPYRYLIDVRANGDTPHAVLGTQAFGVGEVVAVAGQSLAVNFLGLGYSPEGTITSTGCTPAANGYVFAPSLAPADGNTGSPIAPDPAIWAAPADGTAYSSAFAAEFLRLVTGQAGVAAALVGYAAGGTSITAWQPGQGLNTTLKATLDHAGRFGSIIWVQGHSDSQAGMSTATYQGLLTSLFADLAARYTAPGGTPGGFSRLVCSIPAEASNYWGTPAQVNAIRSAALAYVAADPRATYVAGLDMQVSGDGTHPNQAGRLTMGREFYRAFMAAAGLAPAKPGPSIAGATRAAGSAVVKLAITQGAGGTALVGVGTPANQFTVYPANAMFGALAISSLSIVSPTEIDLTLAAAPADTQALDVWYRLADSDSGAITASGIYDNATDGDGLATGRQLQLVAAAIPAAAPNPQAAAAPASGGTVLTFAGPAGTLPSGAATLTPVGTNPPTGMALDGNGALLLPSQTFAYAQLRGLGIQGDGTLEIDAAGGPQPLEVAVILHANADNSINTALIFQGEYGHVGIYVPGAASNPTVLPAPAAFTKIRVTSAGTALTIVADGATIGTVTIPAGASGYVGIGSSSAASPQVVISQVSFLGTTSSAAPTSDGTLTGLPSTIVAGQPLSAASYVPTTGSVPFLVLYNVAAAAEEGSRFTPLVMPGGTLSLLIPQKAGAYTVRGFASSTGGAATYESAQFNATAAPGILPVTPTQTADTGATSSGVTMNWTATGTICRFLARPGPLDTYGSLADVTMTTNSYTFTGLAASSSPRAVVISQNANGYGTPSRQFFSSSTA